MKIGIISTWNNSLSLFKFLNRYDNEYLIFHDQEGFPYDSKNFIYTINRIKTAYSFLKGKWAEYIIVDPIYEIFLLQIWWFDWILPLFKMYLHDYIFKYSLIWKLWVLTDEGSFSECQWLLEKEMKNYIINDNQKQIKHFNFPFKFWVKSASSWVFNMKDLWIHNPYLIRTMKNDLRYFKDSNIDTIIPMHYDYFKVQRHIKSFFNFRKTRFHDLSIIEDCFKSLMKNQKIEWIWIYNVHIWTNQNSKFLLSEKQLVRLLQRWKKEIIKIENIL